MYFIWSKQNIFSICTLTFLVIIFYWNNIVYDNYYYCRIVSFILLCTKILFLIIIQTSLRSIFVLIKSFFFMIVHIIYIMYLILFQRRCHRCNVFRICFFVFMCVLHTKWSSGRGLFWRLSIQKLQLLPFYGIQYNIFTMVIQYYCITIIVNGVLAVLLWK